MGKDDRRTSGGATKIIRGENPPGQRPGTTVIPAAGSPDNGDKKAKRAKRELRKELWPKLKQRFRWIGGKLKHGLVWVASRTPFGEYRDPPLEGTLSYKLWRWTDLNWNLGPHLWQRSELAVKTILERLEYECMVIVTIVIGGGQGKSTTSLNVAQRLTEEHHGHGLLIDLDPSGVLRDNTGVTRESIQAVKDGRGHEACFTVTEAFRNRGLIRSESDVCTHLAKMPGTDLYVIVAGEKGDKPLTHVQYKELISAYSKAVRFIVVDCPPDVEKSATTQAALESAHAVAVPAKHRSKPRIKQAAKLLRMIAADERYKAQRDRVLLVCNEIWLNPLHRGTTRNVRQFNRILNGYEWADDGLLKRIWWTLTRKKEKLERARRDREIDRKLGRYNGPVANQPWNFTIRVKGGFFLPNRSWWFRLHSREIASCLVLLSRQSLNTNYQESRKGSDVQPLEVGEAPVSGANGFVHQPAITGPSA